jgi:hypothetical protein
MTDLDLFAVLDRATDGIDPAASPQHAAVTALARARVVRNRRRGLVAGAVAAVLVLVVAVATGVAGTDRTEPPVMPTPIVPAVPDSAVQATWDPRAAGDLPQRASVLPTEIAPRSGTTGPLPLTGAARLVLADEQERLHLLGEDGTWASTEAPSGSAYVSSLSDDGTMLANAGNDELWVTDVRDGSWRQLDLPPGPAFMWTGLDVTLTWRDDTQLLLRNGGGMLGIVDLDGAEPAEADTHDTAQVTGVAMVPDGTELLFGTGLEGQVIREVEDGQSTRTFVASALGRFRSPLASDTRVAGLVSGIPRDDRPTDHAGVLVLDRTGYAAEAYLPIAGTRYTPGVGIVEISANGVRPMAWLDDHTLLLDDSRALGRPWSLVAWDVETGELSLVSSGGSGTWLRAVAGDLVRD